MKLTKNQANLIYDWYINIKDLHMRLEKDSELSLGRSEYQRDYARILYSSSFRRLQGKTQFLGISSDKFFRNRLTHSLEVSQIAVGIAQKLNYSLKQLIGKEIYNMEDIFVLQSAAIAHDLGHSAFGHNGEEVLNNIAANSGLKEGFESNAQTLRILMNLEKKNPTFKGLNLTLRTLLSVVKYFKPFSYDSPKSLYQYNFDLLKTNIEKYNLSNYMRTLDVQIVDVADEIAYSVHDLEDCLNLNIFTIDELLYEFFIWANTPERTKAYEILLTIVEESKEFARKSSIYQNLEEYKTIFNKFLVSKLVDFLIDDISLMTITKDKKEIFGTYSQLQLGFKDYPYLAIGLKELVFKCLQRDQRIKEYRAKGKIVLEKLFYFYKENPNLMSFEFWEKYKSIKTHAKDGKYRVILDYLAGMMDPFAFAEFEKYFGELKLGKEKRG